MNAGAEVRLDHVVKAFEGGRVRALDDVSFELAPGELVALTGPSGSGKSTLLNLIGALDDPDEGSITLDGQRLDQIRDRDEYRSTTVGFVFQLHNLIPTLTASENVQIAMFGHAQSRNARRARARELLGEVGLAGRVDARPATMSGGERQRVAIARALANEPRLLLADEPTGALDSATGNRVVALLDEVRCRRGTTILLATNDDQVAASTDRVMNLRDGVIRGAELRPEKA